MPPHTRGGGISSAPRRRPTRSERRRRVQLKEVEPTLDRDPVEPALKLVNHGAKLQLWELDAERSRISETVHRSGLAPLTSCSHRVTSRPMLSAFCERWHPETTTFHLPFGEMTITLDDVASILHIPIIGSMISFSQPLRVDNANALLVELLGTTDVEASREREQCRSPSV